MLTPSLNTVMTRLLIGAAVLAALALAVALIAPAASAQDATIEYAENGTDPVRTFTSTDPEGEGILWDVTGLDADDFSIDSRGVLTFKKSPNFEAATDRAHPARDLNGDGDTDDEPYEPAETGPDNVYRIIVRATEMRASGQTGRSLSTESEIFVTVTNVNEPGTVTMNWIQPEVGTQITASVSDPDGNTEIGWQWYVSKVSNPDIKTEGHWDAAAGDGNNTGTYRPAGVRVGTIADEATNDAGKYLRAVASYNDAFATGETKVKAMVVSLNPVRAEVSSDLDSAGSGINDPANGSPGFPSGGDYTRSVPENTAVGQPVGAAVVAIDPNKDTLTYQLDNDNNAGNDLATTGDHTFFSINKATGQLYVKKTLDWDNNRVDPNDANSDPDGKYTFWVRATDPSGETAQREVTVTATDTNDAPKIMGSISSGTIPAAPSELKVDEISEDTGSTYNGSPDMMLPANLDRNNVFTASDEDARGQITWSLSGPDMDDFQLSSVGLRGQGEPIALRFKTAPNYEMPTDADLDSVYKVTLVASDGTAEAKRPLTIFVINLNETRGGVTLSTDQPLTGQAITATVDDPDNNLAVVTWQWLKATTTSDTFNVIPGATSDTYTPVSGDNGQYLQVKVTYTDTTTSPDNASTVNVDERTQSGDDNNPTAKVPEPDGDDGTSGDTYRVMATSKNAVRVGPSTTDPTTAPVFSAASYDRSVAENSEVGSIVGAPVRVNAETGKTFNYDLKASVTDHYKYFTIGTTTGQIRVGQVAFPDPLPAGVIGSGNVTAPTMVDPTLDYEGANTFSLVVTAEDSSDSSRTTTATVNITLTNLNEAPYFDKDSRDRTGSNISYAESRTNSVIRLSATEPDGDGLRWEVTGTDAADFMINDADDLDDGKDRVELAFKSQPNFEKATDRAIDLNNDGDTDDQGEEAAGGNTYRVTVRATEASSVGGGPAKSAELSVTVQVANSDETGMVEMRWLQPEAGTVMPAAVSDPDGPATISVTTWAWYRAKVDNPNRSPNLSKLGTEWHKLSGNGAASANYTPQATDVGKHLLVTASYNDNQANNKMAYGISAENVRADVTPANNNSPDFATNKAERSVPENTAVGMDVGLPVIVETDEDGDILTYELDDDVTAPEDGVAAPANTGDASFFSIDKATGQIKVAKALDFDSNYPTGDTANPDGKYTFYVRATDPSGETGGENRDEIKVIVTATDVNEAPVVTGSAELTVTEATSTFAGIDSLYKVSDQDNADRANWTIAGPDGALFQYSTPDDGIGRNIHFKKGSEPDFEDPKDSNKDNVYEISVRATDTNTVVGPPSLVGQKAVRITVTNVDEPGKLALSPDQPDSGMPVIATVTDPDSPNGVVVTDWMWESATSTASDAVWTPIPSSTTDRHTGKVGEFLRATVDYRDGASVEDDPVTILDERNDNPGTTDTETNHDSDEVMTATTTNAIQAPAPGTGGGPGGPSTDVVKVERMVYENTPSTGYVGTPLKNLGYTAGGTDYTRDTIGGPDGSNFVFAEYYDHTGDFDEPGTPATDGEHHVYYDSVLAPSTDIEGDKAGQLALKPVTHLDYETKDTYIIEISDPNAVVAVGAVEVTIKVLNVNEAPSMPSEFRGVPNVAPEFSEGATTSRSVAENTAAGTNIGAPVMATDADRNDTVTYSLGNIGTSTDAAAFDISTSTGQLMTKAALDYETKNTYMVEVTATDSHNESDTIMVTIMVTDVGLTNAYDVDESGVIESDEVLQAVADYFAGTINQTQVLEVVALYFAGLPPSGS